MVATACPAVASAKPNPQRNPLPTSLIKVLASFYRSEIEVAMSPPFGEDSVVYISPNVGKPNWLDISHSTYVSFSPIGPYIVPTRLRVRKASFGRVVIGHSFNTPTQEAMAKEAD